MSAYNRVLITNEKLRELKKIERIAFMAARGCGAPAQSKGVFYLFLFMLIGYLFQDLFIGCVLGAVSYCIVMLLPVRLVGHKTASAEILRLLSNYKPINIKAYIELQQIIKSKGEILASNIIDWVKQEKLAVGGTTRNEKDYYKERDKFLSK